jgi:hypothetical protein
LRVLRLLVAVSKPVQDKLVTSVPKFLNEQGAPKHGWLGVNWFGCGACHSTVGEGLTL